MKINRPFPLMLVISIVYALLFCFVTNLFFDSLINNVWKPLVIALYFTVFAGLLSVVILLVSQSCGSRTEFSNFGKYLTICLVALFVLSMGLEFVYEIGLSPVSRDTDSYIIVIDDSGSMSQNDPNKIRESAINDLIGDKEDGFTYAVYTFATEYDRVRDMLPKSVPLDSLQLQSDGGTNIAGTLKGIIEDVNKGNLVTTENTRVLLLSDGVASDIGLFRVDLKELLKQYVDKDIVISTIGLGDSVNDNVMKQIANYTGGVYVHVDEANQLSSAMIEASVSSANRNLLSLRGVCKTDTLHAVMRIVFLMIIAVVINLSKHIVYGKYYLPQLVVSCVCVIVSGFFVEFSLELFYVSEGFTRVVLCIFLALMIIEKVFYIEYQTDDGKAPKKNNYRKTGVSEGDLSTVDGGKKMPVTKTLK